MGKVGVKDPTVSPSVRTLRTLFSRRTAGILGTATAVRLTVPHLQEAATTLPVKISGLLGSAVLGFGVGYTSMSVAQWLRWKVIAALLAYHGWMFDQKSTTTKVWGVLLKLFLGPGPFTLFEFQDALPSLPVPELEDTCERYLTFVKPLLTSDEYEQTELAVEEFKKTDGPALQKYLLDKRKKTRNWLADWWLTNAYLARRESIAINVNFMMTSIVKPEVSTDGLARAANTLYSATRYYEVAMEKKLPPDMIMDTIPVCMDGVRYMFGASRIPGEHCDTLLRCPNSKHAIVISKGVYYRLDMYQLDSVGNNKRLTKREIKNQLLFIANETKDITEKNKVAALTSQNRTKWHKDRNELIKSPINAATLDDIETSIFIIILGDMTPESITEMAKLALTGDGTDRWFDKGLAMTIYKDTTMGGCNMEHSGADATLFAVMWEHCLQEDIYGPDGDVIDDPKDEAPRPLPPPNSLQWDFSEDMQSEIDGAYTELRKRIDALDTHVCQTKFGRKTMKTMKVSPDGFLQMALQLAFYRERQEVVKTYEPASHRLFALGRTENINPVSEHSVRFVKAMDDPTSSDEARLSAMRDAISCQSRLRLECTAGYGCERHLLGLSCAARELGMDMPAIFKDKAFNLPIKLSTSQVPTALGGMGLPLVPESILGAFGPACHDGYGVLYVQMNDDAFSVVITCWPSSGVTGAVRFGDNINTAMADMKKVVSTKTKS